MLRSPTSYQRNQRSNRQNHNNLALHKSSTGTPAGVSCTPKHLLYRVPKSIIKTGGSTQNIGSVIKPREFSAYLKAFRGTSMSPEHDVSKPTGVSPAPETPLLSCAIASEKRNPDSIAAPPSSPLLPPPRPRAHPTKPPIATKTLSPSAQRFRPSTDFNIIENCENDNTLVMANMEANPFQPCQKLLARTPPKVMSVPEKRPPIKPQEEATVVRTEVVLPLLERAEDVGGNVKHLAASVAAEKAGQLHLTQPPPVTRVTSGAVLHSPPAGATVGSISASVHPAVPITTHSEEGVMSPAGSAMFRLLSNSYAPVPSDHNHSNNITSSLMEEEVNISLETAEKEVSRRNDSSAGGDELILEEMGEAVAAAPEEVDDVRELDPVQLYAEKLSKKFANRAENQDISTTDQALASPVHVSSVTNVPSSEGVSASRGVAETTSTATSTSFFDDCQQQSIGVMTSFVAEISEGNDDVTALSTAQHQAHLEELRALKVSHFHREKCLHVEVLLRQYHENVSLLNVLDVRKEVRDEKCSRIELEVSIEEERNRSKVIGEELLLVPETARRARLGSAIASPACVKNRKFENARGGSMIINDVSCSAATPQQQISLDFSCVPPTEEEETMSALGDETEGVPMDSHDYHAMEIDEGDCLNICSSPAHNSGECTNNAMDTPVISHSKVNSEEDTSLGSGDENEQCSDDDELVSLGASANSSQFGGMRFVPLRSAKMTPTVGHVPKAAAAVPCTKRSAKSKRREVQKVVMEEERDVVECEQEQRQKKQKPKTKRSQRKPAKENDSRRADVDSAVSVPAASHLPILNVEKQSVISKKEAAAAHVVEFFRTTGSVLSGKTAEAAQVSLYGPRGEVPDNVTEKGKQRASANTVSRPQKTRKDRNTAPSSFAQGEELPCQDSTLAPSELKPYESFCQYTRTSVEDILNEGGRRKKSKKLAQEVDAMLLKMWAVQTDAEREEWENNTSPAAIENDHPPFSGKKVVKSTNRNRNQSSKPKKTDPTIRSEVTISDTKTQRSESIVTTHEKITEVPGEVLTPQSVPVKASKRQKRASVTVDTDVGEHGDEIQEFVPKKKLRKKHNAQATSHTTVDVTYSTALPLKSKMNAMIPKLKSRKR